MYKFTAICVRGRSCLDDAGDYKTWCDRLSRFPSPIPPRVYDELFPTPFLPSSRLSHPPLPPLPSPFQCPLSRVPRHTASSPIFKNRRACLARRIAGTFGIQFATLVLRFGGLGSLPNLIPRLLLASTFPSPPPPFSSHRFIPRSSLIVRCSLVIYFMGIWVR
jgi:hypothetical protein